MLTLLIAGAAGCGNDRREQDARETGERLLAAIEADDAKGACAELSDETSEALEDATGNPCEKEILSLDIGGSRVARAAVYVTSAQLDLVDGGSLFLDETSLGWRVSAAGCEPRPSLPYDCELED